jgi:hypothetical protein
MRNKMFVECARECFQLNQACAFVMSVVIALGFRQPADDSLYSRPRFLLLPFSLLSVVIFNALYVSYVSLLSFLCSGFKTLFIMSVGTSHMRNAQ